MNTPDKDQSLDPRSLMFDPLNSSDGNDDDGVDLERLWELKKQFEDFLFEAEAELTDIVHHLRDPEPAITSVVQGLPASFPEQQDRSDHVVETRNQREHEDAGMERLEELRGRLKKLISSTEQDQQLNHQSQDSGLSARPNYYEERNP